MNNLMKKWLKTLRSGKYEQTEDQLATNDYTKFCCLGVLCEVSGRERTKNGAYKGINDARMFPIKNIMEAFDCKERKARKLGSRLSTWNDAGNSFNVIANKIKEELKCQS